MELIPAMAIFMTVAGLALLALGISIVIGSDEDED